MIKLKKILKCLINPQFIYAYINGISPLYELEIFLKKINKIDNPKIIIDIGSNKGQFILICSKFFKKVLYLSFEPQNKYLILQKKIFKKFKILFYNYALGSKSSLSNFYITNRNDSSSILRPNKKIKDNRYKVLKKENILVKRFDTIFDNKYLKGPILVKIDVQGFELEVLKGFGKIITEIDFIILEKSYFDIYNNQSKAINIDNFLKKKNFLILKNTNLTFYKGRKFQEDILYINSLKYNKKDLI